MSGDAKLPMIVRRSAIPDKKVRPAFKRPDSGIKISTIVEATAYVMGVSEHDIRSAWRARRIVRARHIAGFVARSITRYSLPQIGKALGNRDHSTIVNSVWRVNGNRLEFEPYLTQVMALLGFALDHEMHAIPIPPEVGENDKLYTAKQAA